MAGWGDFFGKVSQQFQGRIERLKNEKIKLEKRLSEIKKSKSSTLSEAAEATRITQRLEEIKAILISKASD